MKSFIAATGSLALLAAVLPPAMAQDKKSQTVTRAGSQPSTKGPAEYFTGNVRVEPLFAANESAPYSGAIVTFEPGARSNWHTHPSGQRLIVTQGVGRTQEWGGPIVEVRAGDHIWCPPGVKHWHGASPTTAMTHITLSGTRDGKNVEWMEKVSDEQYGALAAAGASAAPPEDVRSVAPALEKYTQERLLGEVWKRPGLSERDRSVVTLAVLVARNQTVEMPYYVNLALDSGVKPAEISELITHLAFYSGWGNAAGAVDVTRQIFTKRGVRPDQLPAASPKPLPLDESAEADRAKRVGEQFGAVSPGVVQYTTDALFRDLWLRPDLAPRDRSLVTVSALVASGQVAQMPYHLNRAMDNGLTQAQASEVLTHLAFYAGWPNVFSALPVAKEVFEKRK
jgi:4-carboxymuconolactone decarboxylase